jgi:hypothetical protein
MYVPGKYEGRTAIVRIEIDSSVSAEEKEVIQTLLSDYIDELDGFDMTGNIMDAVRTSIEVEEDRGIDEMYINRIVASLCRVIEHYHPKLSGSI